VEVAEYWLWQCHQIEHQHQTHLELRKCSAGQDGLVGYKQDDHRQEAVGRLVEFGLVEVGNPSLGRVVVVGMRPVADGQLE